jgi:hypothetical protein
VNFDQAIVGALRQFVGSSYQSTNIGLISPFKQIYILTTTRHISSCLANACQQCVVLPSPKQIRLRPDPVPRPRLLLTNVGDVATAVAAINNHDESEHALWAANAHATATSKA